jgi:phage host-nuclease inhibitor protein Gam
MTTPRNREAADQLLRRLGEIEIAMSRIEARMNTAIQRAEDQATEDAGEAPAERVAIEEALQEFFLIERKNLPPKARSLKLTFGTLGVKPSTTVEVIRCWNESQAIAALAAAGREELIRQTLSLHKPAIHEAAAEDDEMFRHCGILINRSENFYAKPNLLALAKVATR